MPGEGETWCRGTGGCLQLSITLSRADPKGVLSPLVRTACQDGRWLCAWAPCPSQCAVGGHGHHHTFDGRSFSFSSKPGSRSIQVQVRGGGGVGGGWLQQTP